jgi:hypothetical protein|nr:MAG TPA: hypothetical protein [Caudoviricetes sp.]
MSEISDKDLSSILQDINSQDAADELKIGGITLVEAHKRSVESRKARSIERKQREKEIIQEAINSTFIDLNAPMSVAHKKLLIKLLTDTYTQSMVKNETYINKRISEMLKLIIPSDLLNAYRLHKGSVVPADGFMYMASKEYGQGLQFKVSLDLPFYFHPNDIQPILAENWPERLINIDKAIVSFYKNKKTRTKREVAVAQQLTRISTFFQLVKKNPFWYDILVQELRRQADEQADEQAD